VPLSDIAIQRSSEIVKRIVSTKFDGVADTYILKVRAELINGWFIDFWEHKTPRLRRYSFHVSKDGKMIINGIMRHITLWSEGLHTTNISESA